MKNSISKLVLFLANLFLAFFLLVFQSVPARADESKFDVPVRPFLIKPYIEAPALNLELRAVGSGSRVIWSPNYRAQTGLSLSYQGLIGVSASAKGELSRADAALKGRTDYSDFRFNFPWRRLAVEFGFQNLKGFYAENTTEFSPGSNQYLLRPELSLESYYLGFTFATARDHYSLAAAFDQSERQISSGGTWLLTLKATSTAFQDASGTPLIPTQLQPNFPTESLISKGEFVSITGGGGYGYTWAFGKTGYAFGQLLLGFGAQTGKSADATRQFTTSENAGLLKADLGIGSNGEIHVTGIRLSLDQTSNRTVETELGKRNILLHVFYGFRL